MLIAHRLCSVGSGPGFNLSSRYTTFKVVQSSCHSRYTNSCLVSVVFKSLCRSCYTTGLQQGGHTLRGQEDSLMSLSGRLRPQRGTDAPATSRLSFPPWPGSRQCGGLSCSRGKNYYTIDMDCNKKQHCFLLDMLLLHGRPLFQISLAIALLRSRRLILDI